MVSQEGVEVEAPEPVSPYPTLPSPRTCSIKLSPGDPLQVRLSIEAERQEYGNNCGGRSAYGNNNWGDKGPYSSVTTININPKEEDQIISNSYIPRHDEPSMLPQSSGKHI